MDDEILAASVGAGLAVCLRDRRQGIGGVALFLLAPEPGETIAIAGPVMRGGNLAVERLITALQKRGGRREDFELMVFGGAHVGGELEAAAESCRQFIRRYLELEQLKVRREELGGEAVRVIEYSPADGRFWVGPLRLASADAQAVVEAELDHLRSLDPEPHEDDILLF